jgi:hypothetical protein
MAKTTALSCALRVLPWVFVPVGVLLLVVGLSWRNLSDSDTANGALIAFGILLVMIACALSCAADRSPLRASEDDEAPQAAIVKVGGQVPFVSI